jgi:hypothetical protein
MSTSLVRPSLPMDPKQASTEQEHLQPPPKSEHIGTLGNSQHHRFAKNKRHKRGSVHKGCTQKHKQRQGSQQPNTPCKPAKDPSRQEGS